MEGCRTTHLPRGPLVQRSLTAKTGDSLVTMVTGGEAEGGAGEGVAMECSEEGDGGSGPLAGDGGRASEGVFSSFSVPSVSKSILYSEMHAF